jgi:hypothetical protein
MRLLTSLIRCLCQRRKRIGNITRLAILLELTAHCWTASAMISGAFGSPWRSGLEKAIAGSLIIPESHRAYSTAYKLSNQTLWPYGSYSQRKNNV